MVDLLIVGSGGLAREMAQLARQIDPDALRWRSIAYVAERADELDAELLHGRVEYTDETLQRRREPADVVIGVGYPGARRAITRRLAGHPALRFPNLVHPWSPVDPAVVALGEGNVVTRGVVMTCSIAIGNFNLFNWNVTVGHDALIGDCNVFNPATNLSGNTVIGDACLFGTGCQVLERLSIASCTTVGAGAVVTRSITDAGGTYVGVPARKMC